MRVVRFLIAVSVFSAGPAVAVADDARPLPKYDLAVTLDTANHKAEVVERVTWTNNGPEPVADLVFNFYPHYRIPAGDYLHLAKTLELLRLQPSLGIEKGGRHGVVTTAKLVALDGKNFDTPPVLRYEFAEDNATALRFVLPQPVPAGRSVTVEIACCVHLPNKQGRWGHWDGVHFLTNAIPLLAYRDAKGWQPMPFVPWHQPWYNEAGIFTAAVTLPAAETLACPAVTRRETTLPNGWKKVETEPFTGRDFAFLCSARYREFRSTITLPDGKPVTLRCLAFAEHEWYAKEILTIVGDAIPVYSRWFGAFPYSQFTVAESYFGWNGNECAGLIMIDERVFASPHLGRDYVEYLVSHETCHQWWYNVVGTNGYREPFMDEGAASYFTHRMLDRKKGKNNAFMKWPEGFGWMPNIHRENYRYGPMHVAIRNGQMPPAAQDLPEFQNLYGLFTGAYDRGSKVYGMIEDRLGEAGFLDFIRIIFTKYRFGVLHVADLRRELEEYTGKDWGEFFDRWVYGKGMTDWQVTSVKVGPNEDNTFIDIGYGPRLPHYGLFHPNVKWRARKVEVIVRQAGEYDEPTHLGFSFQDGDGFPLRVPIGPTTKAFTDPDSRIHIEPVGAGFLKVTLTLPDEPTQVTIDPDNVLLDSARGNNSWKSTPTVRVSPLLTALDHADFTNDYDRWNFLVGPWVYGQNYADPWYTRSTLVGLRATAYRTQEFNGGAYAAYRTDYRDLVVGVDGVFLGKKSEFGFNYERRVGGPYGDQDGAGGPERASVYARHVIQQGSSLYLPPIMYQEGFASYQDNFLPNSRTPGNGAVRPTRWWLAGYHYRANLYTPYWDPECGFWADVTAAGGQAQLGDTRPMGQLRAELAAVRKLPDSLGVLGRGRVAGRLAWTGATPDEGQFVALGGGTVFRGYDLAQKQGSMMWVGNVEVRYPLVRDVEWDVLDHLFGGRNLWAVGFYDVGDVYANGRSVGGRVNHAVGAGLRLDIAVFSFIERATLRFDAGKTLNDATPFQFWFGASHAF